MKNIISLNLILLFFAVFVVDAAGPKDLIIHLPFEGDGKEVKDVSTNKFKGEIVGKAKSVPGIVGKAREFNGGAAKFDPLEFDVPKEMTIEFWFKPSGGVKCGSRMDGYIISKEWWRTSTYNFLSRWCYHGALLCNPRC